MTTNQPARFARVVEKLFADWIKVNTYGSRDDGSYEVIGETPTTVRWNRIGQPGRTYLVTVASGKAVGCECQGSRRWGKCLHRTITAGLIHTGKLVMPLPDESVYADQPAGWLEQTEWE